MAQNKRGLPKKWDQTRFNPNQELTMEYVVEAINKRHQFEERLPRYFANGCVQHVIQRGNNQDIIFAVEEDYRFYLECLEEAILKHDLAIHAYVLMTNHVDLLVSPAHKDSIPKTTQSVGRRYVQFFNYQYKRTGTSPHQQYLLLANTEKDRLHVYRTLFKNSISEAVLDKIRESTNKAWALGDSRFSERIAELTERRPQPLNKSCPKKH